MEARVQSPDMGVVKTLADCSHFTLFSSKALLEDPREKNHVCNETKMFIKCFANESLRWVELIFYFIWCPQPAAGEGGENRILGAWGSNEKASSKRYYNYRCCFCRHSFVLQYSLKLTSEQFSRVTLGKNYRLHHQNLHKIVSRLTEFCTAMYQVVSTL